MERNIKVLEEFIDSIGEEYTVRMEKAALRDLIEGYRDKDRDNKKLCRLYERTAVKLQELRVRIEDMLRKYDVMLEAAKKDPTSAGVRRANECMEVKMAILDIMGADWNVNV